MAKYAVPGRRLKEIGIPSSTQWTGVALGLIGFFVIPVIGLFLGFVLGVYLAERRRVGAAAGASHQGGPPRRRPQHRDRAAWPARSRPAAWVVGVVLT